MGPARGPGEGVVAMWLAVALIVLGVLWALAGRLPAGKPIGAAWGGAVKAKG